MRGPYFESPIIRFVCCVLIAIGLHLILLVAAWPKEKPKPPPPPLSVNLESPVAQEMQNELELMQRRRQLAQQQIIQPQQVTQLSDCHKSYVGIGLILQLGSNQVTLAPVEYPAYKAGIRIGDEYLDDGPDKVTKTSLIHVKRHGRFLQFLITPSKICYT